MSESDWGSSFLFFLPVMGLSMAVFLLRASPLMRATGGLAGTSWSEWIAVVIAQRLRGDGEHALVRWPRLALALAKYGICGWGYFHFSTLDTGFWTLVWALLLVLALLRRQGEFLEPSRWEHVSLKLDAEHFWLIHLCLLGTAELYLPSTVPWGLAVLVAFHMVVNGESGPSLLSAFEDVIGVGLALLALWSMVPVAWIGLPDDFLGVWALTMPARGFVRAALGRDWLRRRFWWVAQFCLMTSLLVKAMAVLHALPLPHP